MEDWLVRCKKRSKLYRNHRQKEQPLPLRQTTQERADLPKAWGKGCSHSSLDGREIAGMPGRQKSSLGCQRRPHEKVTSWQHSATKFPRRGARGSCQPGALLAAIHCSSWALRADTLQEPDAGESARCRIPGTSEAAGSWSLASGAYGTCWRTPFLLQYPFIVLY